MIFGLFKSRVTKVTVKKGKKASAGKIKKAKAKSKKPARLPARRAPKTKKSLRRTTKLKVKKPFVEEVVVGKVTHYFPHVKAGVVKIKKTGLALGDEVRFKGHTSDFRQKVTSMQINGVPIKKAQKGKEIGLLVKRRVRHNDIVYKVSR